MTSVSPPLVVDDPRLDMFARRHYVTLGVMLSLSTLAIILRFYARRHRGIRLGWDDVLAAMSWIFCVGVFSLSFHSIKNGAVGHDRTNLAEKNIMQVSMSIYAGSILSCCIVTSARLSVLLLYKRGFSSIKTFQIQIWIVGGLCIAWFFAAGLPAIFKCSPVRAGWDITLLELPTTKCFDFQKWFMSAGVVSCILDFAVAGIAISVLRNILLTFAQKAGLTFLFLLTALVAIIDAIRNSLTYKLNVGGQFSSGRELFWSTILNGLCVICCCLPAYGSLLNSFARGIANPRSFVLDTHGSAKLSNNTRSDTRRAVGTTEYELGFAHSDGIPLDTPYWKVGSTQSGEVSKSVEAADCKVEPGRILNV